MSTDGRVDEFTLPNIGSLPNGIVAGPDGNMWFTELAGAKIGRLSAMGELTEYPLPAIGTPLSIAAGPTAALWVTIPKAHAVCKISPDGRAMTFNLPETVIPSFIVAGADGNLWFTEPTGKIGRLTPTGTLTEFPVTTRDADNPGGTPEAHEERRNKELLKSEP
jgi:virginiamycin B lyase